MKILFMLLLVMAAGIIIAGFYINLRLRKAVKEDVRDVKICRTCKREQPITEFGTYAVKYVKPDGKFFFKNKHYADCKECRRAAGKRSGNKNPLVIRLKK